VYSKGSGTLVNVALLNGDVGGAVVVDVWSRSAGHQRLAGWIAAEHFHRWRAPALNIRTWVCRTISKPRRERAITVQAGDAGRDAADAQSHVVCRDRYVDRAGQHRRRAEQVVLLDDNQPPATGSAGVRFVNTSASIPSVDVFVNFGKLVTVGAEHRIVVPQSHGLASDGRIVRVRFQHFRYGDGGAQVARRRIIRHKYTVYLAGLPGRCEINAG
jgi:hypothetical protein